MPFVFQCFYITMNRASGIDPDVRADLLQCRSMTLNRDIAGNALQDFFFFRSKHISSLNVLIENTGNPGEAERRTNVLPFVGRISAGKPIEAVTDQEEINFSELLLGTDRYVLKIDGDSMIDAGIHDGDYVVIKHADTAKSGDIVVALIDQSEATLKRLKKRRKGVELIPENSSMEPMFYDAERVQIQGVLVGQVRLY